MRWGTFGVDLMRTGEYERPRGASLRQRNLNSSTYFARHPGKVITHRAILDGGVGRNNTEQPGVPARFLSDSSGRNWRRSSEPRYILRTRGWVTVLSLALRQRVDL